MIKKYIITKKYLDLKGQLESIIKNFETSESFDYEKRNKMRSIQLDGVKINVKSFKIPNIINHIAYKFFRKSKAERSYIYANILLKKDIKTPEPIAYYEFFSLTGIKHSYYISEHVDYDIMYRTLVANSNYPEHEKILRQFTQFSYKMHEKGIYFIDHTPGNTLIKKNGENYDFYLVDLNRMKFIDLSFDDRMKNLSKITPKEDMVRVMSDEYAKLINEPFEKVFSKMWSETQKFQYKYHRRQNWKKRIFGTKES